MWRTHPIPSYHIPSHECKERQVVIFNQIKLMLKFCSSFDASDPTTKVIIEIRGKSKPPAPPPRSVTTRLSTDPKPIRRSSAGDALDCLIYEKSNPNLGAKIANDATLTKNESTPIQDVVVSPVRENVNVNVTSVHHVITPIRKGVSSVQNNKTATTTIHKNVTLNRTNVTLNRTDVTTLSNVAPARPPKLTQLKKVKFHPQIDVSKTDSRFVDVGKNDSKFVDVNLGSDSGSLKPLDPNFLHFLPKLDRHGSDHKSGISYFEPYL